MNEGMQLRVGAGILHQSALENVSRRSLTILWQLHRHKFEALPLACAKRRLPVPAHAAAIAALPLLLRIHKHGAVGRNRHVHGSIKRDLDEAKRLVVAR